MAAEGIGFAGKHTVLDGDSLLASGIQLASQQFAFQFLDDRREVRFQLVYCLLCPFTYQRGSVGQKVQAVMLLNETGSKARRHGMGQAPLSKNAGGLV